MRMPLLQKGIPMTANLQRTQLMLRHPTDGGNRAVAQPELRFLPTFLACTCGGSRQSAL
jgi:hypothetical protein